MGSYRDRAIRGQGYRVTATKADGYQNSKAGEDGYQEARGATRRPGAAKTKQGGWQETELSGPSKLTKDPERDNRAGMTAGPETEVFRLTRSQTKADRKPWNKGLRWLKRDEVGGRQKCRDRRGLSLKSGRMG